MAGVEYGLAKGSLVNCRTNYQAIITRIIATSQSPGHLSKVERRLASSSTFLRNK